MKWKKDSYYDSIEHIQRSEQLKTIISLKNCIAQDPNGCIPISQVSKRGLELGLPVKAAQFLRQYPAIFEEFIGPQYDLSWFRLTQEAVEIDREEKRLFEDCRDDLKNRIKRFILMSKRKALPLKIIQGMQWLVEKDDGLTGLAVESEKKIFSMVQRTAKKRGVYSGEPMEAIEFPLFPAKGLRLRRKIEDWLREFQKLPYVSPYEDFHIKLMKESKLILKNRSLSNQFVDCGKTKLDLDLNSAE
nr:protein root primordium defective 1 [Quercus suber]